jgi:hypothetical protein
VTPTGSASSWPICSSPRRRWPSSSGSARGNSPPALSLRRRSGCARSARASTTIPEIGASTPNRWGPACGPRLRLVDRDGAPIAGEAIAVVRTTPRQRSLRRHHGPRRRCWCGMWRPPRERGAVHRRDVRRGVPERPAARHADRSTAARWVSRTTTPAGAAERWRAQPRPGGDRQGRSSSRPAVRRARGFAVRVR